jgi:flavin-binding protein dodecin
LPQGFQSVGADAAASSAASDDLALAARQLQCGNVATKRRTMSVGCCSRSDRVVPQDEEDNMSVAKISEITSTSKTSFDDAIADGIKRASKTIHGISGAWVADQEVTVKSGKIVEYKVRLRLTFLVDEKN